MFVDYFTKANLISIIAQNTWIITMVIAIAVYKIILFTIPRIIFKHLKKLPPKYLRSVENNRIKSVIRYLIIAIYLTIAMNIFSNIHSISKKLEDLMFSSCTSLIIILLYTSAWYGIDFFLDIHALQKQSKRLNLKPVAQISKITLSIYTLTILLSHIFHIKYTSIFTSVGALAAAITFVFKDTIVGFISSLQITMYDMLRIDDWIELPLYQVQGTVEEINITTIKIRNFDETVSTIPTTYITSSVVKNYRRLSEMDIRRIARSIPIDINTIKHCEHELIDKLLENGYITKQDITSGDLNNINLYQKYIRRYISSINDFNTQNFTFLVRQLAPDANILPIQIYIFVSMYDWSKFEDIQSKLFGHVISVAQHFELQFCQYASLEYNK